MCFHGSFIDFESKIFSLILKYILNILYYCILYIFYSYSYQADDNISVAEAQKYNRGDIVLIVKVF